MEPENGLKRNPDAQLSGDEPVTKKMRLDEPSGTLHEDIETSPTGGPSSPTRSKDGKDGKKRKPMSKAKRREKEDMKEKKNARDRRRGTWGPREPREQAGKEGEAGVEGQGDEEGTTRLPKRKVALLVGFCGTGCRGMQYNPPWPTIEGILFDALIKAGCISADNADDPMKVGLSRAARTDAGVHAAGNVVGMKIILQPEGVTDVVAEVNSHLPPQIRLWGWVRTNNNFVARTCCDSRVYEYLFPSYMLLPPKPMSKMALQIASDKPISDEQAAELRLADDQNLGEMHPFWKGHWDETDEALLERKRSWRVGMEKIEKLRALVKAFEGTHNFWNYTIMKEFKDKTVKRYMINIEVRDPQAVGDMEWVSVKFHGQSFMLHQIRKMISMAILACRASAPPTLILESYGPQRIRVPKAPALGLLLESPLFSAYNSQQAERNVQLTRAKERGKDVADTEFRDPIDFSKYAEEMQQFKMENIYDKLREREKQTATFDLWLRAVDEYPFYDFAFLNSKGIIPPEAVVANNAAIDGKRYEVERKLRLQEEAEEDEMDEKMGNTEEMEG